MANYITIDGGTTNTRINLVKNNEVVDSLKFNVGAKNGSKLKETVEKGIKNILENNKMSEKDIEKILACGMITSEFGLCNLPHITAPAGLDELSESMFETTIEISQIPFVFVRGVKIPGENFQEVDMMRGEETELMGFNIEKDTLYVLPGSHSKLIYTDEKGRISKFSTELTGELISAVSKETILKDCISFEAEADEEYLLKGYDYAVKEGVNAAFFKTRILKNLFNCNENQTFGFFLGAALSCEIENIIKSSANKVIIGGKKELKLPMAHILKNNCKKEVVCLDEKTTGFATTTGMIKIYENLLTLKGK